jgi:transcriptional regulator with PAS, ATPase and Fis domain
MGDSTTTTASVARWSHGSEDSAQIALVWVFSKPRVTLLPKDKLVIGRSPECAVQLQGDQISRQHAEIVHDGPIHVIRDLGSKNGTFHNGRRVAEAVLEAQDVIRVGDWVGVVANVGKGVPKGVERVTPQVLAGATLREVLDEVRRAAASDLSVILVGETGTGKEVIAQLIHQWSERTGQLVAVNCAALPQSLAEAELFGHQKGAFTGADRARQGLFREADRGTLLLDEIQELSPEIQAKMLRVLQDGKVTPIGESRPTAIDVRVVAAGQSSLEQAVAQRKFRGDLYARLAGLELKLPPLRERREEIVPIFLATLNSELRNDSLALDVTLIERLAIYDWPFNVREVIQCAKQMAVLHGHESLFTEAHLPERLRRERSQGAGPSAGVTVPERAERKKRREQTQGANDRQLEKLVVALRAHGGNVSKAATELGISRQRAYRLMDLRPDLDIGDVRYPVDD